MELLKKKSETDMLTYKKDEFKKQKLFAET